jgi:Flp pilus assembly protein TadD
MKSCRWFFIALSVSVLGSAVLAQQGQQNQNSTLNQLSNTTQNFLKGEFLLPGGDVPNVQIKYELQNSLGMHDIEFTDSNGRFTLENLDNTLNYTIVVESDGQHWGETRYQFVFEQTPFIRIYLKALPASKDAAPVAVSANSGYTTPDPKLKEDYESGVKAFKAGKVAESEKLLRQATEGDPKYAVAFNALGVVLMSQRKYDESEQAFRKGLVADPKSPALQLALGTVLVRDAKYDDAVAPLQEAVRLQPANGDAHLQLGAALVETQHYADAEKELLSAEQLKGASDVGVQLYLGKLFSLSGQYAKAIDAFNAYLKLAPPDSPNSPAIRAAIQRMQAEIAKAEGHQEL